MNILITVYKPTGKYYASGAVHIPNFNPSLWSEEFLKCVRDNLPARYGAGGFIVVQDIAPVPVNEFHNCLLKYDELFPISLGAHFRLEAPIGDIPKGACVEICWVFGDVLTIQDKRGTEAKVSINEFREKAIPCTTCTGGD